MCHVLTHDTRFAIVVVYSESCANTWHNTRVLCQKYSHSKQGKIGPNGPTSPPSGTSAGLRFACSASQSGPLDPARAKPEDVPAYRLSTALSQEVGPGAFGKSRGATRTCVQIAPLATVWPETFRQSRTFAHELFVNLLLSADTQFHKNFMYVP